VTEHFSILPISPAELDYGMHYMTNWGASHREKQRREDFLEFFAPNHNHSFGIALENISVFAEMVREFFQSQREAGFITD
jgi:hypothetical protein